MTLFYDKVHNTIIDPLINVWNDEYYNNNKIYPFVLPEDTTEWTYDGHKGLYLVVNGKLEYFRIPMQYAIKEV